MAINTDELKRRCDIADVMESFGAEFALDRRGRRWRGTVHDSLEVDPDAQVYQWYSKGGSNNGHGGDVIAFLQNEIGLEFMEACQLLSERSGVPLELGEKEKKRWVRAQAAAAAIDVVGRFLQRKRAGNEAATAYARRRGWDDGTIATAQLGFWDGDRKGLLDELRLHEVPVDHPVAVALLGFEGDVRKWAERYELTPPAKTVEAAKVWPMRPGMLVYPHLDRGRWRYFAGRAIDPDVEKKWAHWNPQQWLLGNRVPCWNVAYDRRSAYVVVVEGQADAVTLGMWGIPAVALAGVVPGEKGDAFLGVLRGHQKVFVALDADEAGEKGGRALAEALGPATFVVTWPGGGDANDWLTTLGATAEKCQALLANAPIFALHMARKVYQVPELERAAARRMVYEMIASLMPYDYATYAGSLAEAMGLVTGSGSPNTAELNRVIRAIKTERDLAAQGVEEAKPVKEAPKVTVREPGNYKELTPEMEEVLLQRSRDHEGHAQCCYALYKDRLAFVPEWGWLFYDGKKWELDGADHKAQGLVVRTLKMRRHLGVEKEVENLVKSTAASNGNVQNTKALLERLVLASSGDFDKDPDLLNCNNGVVNLKTGELVPHDSLLYRFTYCLPIDYKPGLKYYDWLQFLVEVTSQKNPAGGIFTDRELTDWIQEAVGYSLTGHTKENCLFYLYGPTRSGKGTFTQTIQRVLGKPLAAGIDFNLLVQQRGEDSQNFALAPLKPCRMLVGSEPGKYERFNEAKMKMLTGEDTVRCSFKRRDHFEYEPQFKIWLSSNWPFNADVADAAAWGRARIIKFPNSFLGNEDKDLKHRLQSREGLESVLTWAVEGAMRWYASSAGLRTPVAVEEEVKDQRDSQDYIKQFLDDCCEVAEGDPTASGKFVTSEELYNAYYEWAKGMMTPQQHRSFGLAIKGKGFPDGRKYVEVGQLYLDDSLKAVKTKRLRGYWGLELNADGKEFAQKKVKK